MFETQILVKDLKFLIPDKKKIWLQSDQLSTPLRHSLPLDPVTDTCKLRFMNLFQAYYKIRRNHKFGDSIFYRKSTILGIVEVESGMIVFWYSMQREKYV